MKYSLAASFAMAALVGAAPLNNKRDIVYATETVEEWVTEWTTTTVWVDELPAAAATSTPAGGFFEVKNKPKTTSVAAPSTNSAVKPSSSSAPAPSSQSTPVAPVVIPSASSSPSIAPAPVAPTSPTSTYVAPSPTSTSVAPVVQAPSTTAAPAVSTTTAPAYVAPASTTSTAPVVSASTSSSGGSGTSTGDMTYYDVSVGLTSCGLTGSNSDFLVAMNKPDMANGANPNNNPKCNKYINIYYNGVGPIKGKVVDTCPECVSGAIDVTDSLFKAVAPNGDGRVHGVSWSWA